MAKSAKKTRISRNSKNEILRYKKIGHRSAVYIAERLGIPVVAVEKIK